MTTRYAATIDMAHEALTEAQARRARKNPSKRTRTGKGADAEGDLHAGLEALTDLLRKLLQDEDDGQK